VNRSIPVVGWSIIVLSGIVILMELAGLFQSTMMDRMESLLGSFPQSHAILDSMNTLFFFSRIWSVYTIIYFVFAIIGSIWFNNYLEKGRKMLEIVCWIGFFNACADMLLNYYTLSMMRNAALKAFGPGTGSIFILEIITLAAGFLLWTIPTVGMLLYLRSSSLKSSMLQ
jgi:hypothetical protein